MFYLGVRNKDNSILSLKGTTTSDRSTNMVNGAIFNNGDINYKVIYDPPRLVVSQQGKILVDQHGEWRN